MNWCEIILLCENFKQKIYIKSEIYKINISWTENFAQKNMYKLKVQICISVHEYKLAGLHQNGLPKLQAFTKKCNYKNKTLGRKNGKTKPTGPVYDVLRPSLTIHCKKKDGEILRKQKRRISKFQLVILQACYHSSRQRSFSSCLIVLLLLGWVTPIKCLKNFLREIQR